MCWLWGCFWGVGEGCGDGVENGLQKLALEKLLPHSSPLCFLCSLSCGSFSSIEDATGTRVGAFPKGLSYKEVVAVGTGVGQPTLPHDFGLCSSLQGLCTCTRVLWTHMSPLLLCQAQQLEKLAFLLQSR